jgi:asparagine synthase (glutamine-hydrolysing)
MCGIVGVLSFGDARYEVGEQLISEMRDVLAHRGPDGAGTWISNDRRIGLGHRRLAILDLSSAATQPMQMLGADLWIVFNGEIYNHATLRDELIQRGYVRWQTDHSDTEVILHAFHCWGIDAVKRLRGMFAFAIWDGRTRELWLIRDRIGVKPLYYAIHRNRVVFASEIKAILRDRELAREVDGDSLYHYLSFLTTPAPRTLFGGIEKVPPASWVRITARGQISRGKYWNLWSAVTPLTRITEPEAVERLRVLLAESVRLRAISDVPVGVFLSGGIDSSTNAALLARLSRVPIKTFTIGYRGNHASYQNEFAYAREMAVRIGSHHHELQLTADDLIGFMPRMVELQDEPIADPVCFPVYFVSQLARSAGVPVCQIGEGADELFCGYPSWLRMLRLQKMARAIPIAGLKRMLATCLSLNTGLKHSFVVELLRRSGDRQPIFWSGAEAFTDAHKRDLLSTDMLARRANGSSWPVVGSLFNEFQDTAWQRSDLNWMTFVDLSLRLPELLLMRIDKMSMGVSLEGREPFLDHELIEFMASLPTEMKLRNGETKYILKKAVRGLIPDAIIDRPKQGFGVPVHEWLLDKLGLQVRSELRYFCQASGLLRWESVDRVLNSHRSWQTWQLFNLALWWRRYIEEGSLDTSLAA